MTQPTYTHYGWFYFVPINYRDVPPDCCLMAMRWTDWHWPIAFAAGIHNFITMVTGFKSDFPVMLTGVYL